MADIQFYHLSTAPLIQVLPKLLEKALQAKLRAVVLAESEEKAEMLATLLWNYDPDSFLPHGTEKDGNPELQPVYITSRPSNPNAATLLVVTDGSELELEASLARLLDIYDGNDAGAEAKAAGRMRKYREAGHSVSVVRQSASGSWQKEAA